MAEEVHAQQVLADSQPRPSTQQRITQSTLASTKQQMQQVKTIDNPNNSKVPPGKRIVAPTALQQNQGNHHAPPEAESAMSSTDHAQQ